MSKKVLIGALMLVGIACAMDVKTLSQEKKKHREKFLAEHTEFEEKHIIAIEVDENSCGTVTTQKEIVRSWNVETGLELKKF